MELKITLKAARVNANMNQLEASKLLEVSKKTLILWEKGEKEPTKAQKLLISNIYKIDQKYIFFDQKTHKE